MEYPASDPAPLKFAPPSNLSSPPSLYNFSQPVVHVPAHPVHQLRHPPYEEMIRRAVMALNEKDGSSKQKIGKYIENEFHVPPSHTHSYELTHTLKQMKTFGQLIMVKHSYMLSPVALPQVPQPSLGPYVGPSQPASAQPSLGASAQPSLGPYVGSSAQPSFGAYVGPSQPTFTHGPSQPVSASLGPYAGPSQPTFTLGPSQPDSAQLSLGAYVGPSQPTFTLGPSQPTFTLGPSQPTSAPFVVSLGPSEPPTAPSQPVAVSDGHKRKPGRPAKLKPVSVVSPNPTPSPSPPVGFAAFSPKQFGVPTTNLFGGLIASSPPHQFGAGPITVTNVSSTGHVTGPLNNASTMIPVNEPVNGVPTSGPVSNVSLTGPVSGPMNNVPSIGLHGGSANNVSSMGLVNGPVFDPATLAKVGPSKQVNESAGVASKVDYVMFGAGLESSAGPLVVSTANNPTVAHNNDGPLLVVSAVPDSVAQNDAGPSTVLGKRGRGRPPKIGGPKKVLYKPAMHVRKGRRGRPKRVPISSISLRPRGRPRKNDGGAIVAGDGVLPVARIPSELHDRSLGCPTKDARDTTSLQSEINLMACQALKAKMEHYQERIKSVVSTVKPFLNESAVVALDALHGLEDLINIDIISVPAYAPSAPVDNLPTPVNVQEAATQNIESVPSTAEDGQLTLQDTPLDDVVAHVTSQSKGAPVRQQEPPHQS